MSVPPPTPPPPPSRDTAPPPAGAAGPPPPGAAGPPPPPVDEPRRLSRLRHGKVLGGVAAGLAAHLRVDPVLTRVGFVILAFVPFPGFGLLLYLVLLLILPVSEDPAALPERDRTAGRGTGFYIGVALVALGGIWVLGAASGGGDLFPLLLVGLGVALWVDADRRGDRAVPPPTPTSSWAGASPVVWDAPPTSAPTAPPDPIRPDHEVAAAMDVTTSPPPAPSAPAAGAPTGSVRTWTPPAGEGPGAPGGPPRPPVGRSWTPPPGAERPPRDRSPLGQITIGLALLAAGAVWLLGQLDVVAASGTAILAAPLAVLGAGLLVGSVVGRARWLTLLAIPLAVVTLGAALLEGLDLPLRDGFDERRVVISSAEQLEGPFGIAGGALELDLTEFEPPANGDPLVVSASVAGGELVVIVPDGTGLEGRVRVQAGELYVLGETRTGIAIERDLDIPADAGSPTYEVDLLVGAGELRIDERPALEPPAPPAPPAPPTAPGADEPIDPTDPTVES